MSYRSYMVYGPSWTPMVKRLIIINTVIFILLALSGSGWKLIPILGLVPSELKLWQLFTYMFLHGGIFHLFFNMLALWMFGGELEGNWGSREFLKYYFITGVGAGVFTWLFSMRSPVPTIGSSGAIFGILMAYALMFPNRLVYLFFLFPIRAKHLVLLFVVIELYASWRHTPDGIGHLAHLGGMLVGFLYLKYGWRVGLLLKGYIREKREQRLDRVRFRKEQEVRELQEQVDFILDKISREGMDSLTPKEKEFLRRASSLLRKRGEKF